MKQNIVSLLQQNGIALADNNIADNAESPWLVKALLAFSGWLASLFMLGFFASLFSNLFNNAAACLVIGIALVVAAYFVLRLPQSEFLEHMGLAVSLAGQALIAIAVFQQFKIDDVTPWLLIAIIQITLAVVMPNFVHGVFSAFLAAMAFAVAFADLGLLYLSSSAVLFIVAWLWLNEFNYSTQHRKMLAIAYGLTLSLVLLKATVLFDSGSLLGLSAAMIDSSWKASMDELLNCVILFYVAWQLIKQTNRQTTAPLDKNTVIPVLLAMLVFSLASFQANGLVVGLVVILLGFSASNRILLGLGVASMLLYVSAYYYLLDTTLLVKSGTLLMVGLALFLMRWLISSNLLVKGGAKNA